MHHREQEEKEVNQEEEEEEEEEVRSKDRRGLVPGLDWEGTTTT